MIEVGARSSPLSRRQVEEVFEALKIPYKAHFLESTGDLDQKTSLRTLDKTDFFTREIDQMVLKGECRVGVHSAKDLPEPIPLGLKIIAITQGIDPSDSLVLREFDTLASLKTGSVIATSSVRREEAVRLLRADLSFKDLRGTIHKRLELLETGEADGVVVAEAALLRLNLAHLNRVRLPGPTTPLQGQLAIVAKEDDQEMAQLFSPLDSRKMPKALYLGPEYPLNAFPHRRIVHCPLIETVPCSPTIEDWKAFTHVIFTSKTAVKMLASHLRSRGISPFAIGEKKVITVGEATGEVAKAFGADPLIAEEETAEGVVTLLKTIKENAYFFWPHASKARSVIKEALKKARLSTCILYDTVPLNTPLPDLSDFQEILFSSPTTVSAFFTRLPFPPKHLQFTAIGPITKEALEKYTLPSQRRLL